MNDDIDFVKIFRSIKRKKITILIFSSISFVASVFYALPKEHIWRGEFEVLLKDNSIKSGKSFNGSLDIGITNLIQASDQEFNTEVSILKSSSVLMPVFELAKSYKNQDSIGNWRFSDWFQNLKISVIPSTKILNIKYTNTNKESIIPILESIYSTYQIYSNEKKLENDKKNVALLNQQINDFKLKTEKSIRTFEEFSKENDLTPGDLITTGDGVSSYKYLSKEESNRLIKKGEIKMYSQLLNLMQVNDSITKERDKIFAAVLPVIDLDTDPIFQELLNVEKELKKRENFYYPNDAGIKILNDQRLSLVSQLKESIINKISTQLEILNMSYNLDFREDIIFSKYRELNREVIRNEKTLSNLENIKANILLNNQSNNDPLQLIKKPILEKFPFAPNKKRIVLLGTFMGLIISILFSYFTDKKRNLIFLPEEIKRILNFPILYEFELSDNKIFLESTELIASKIIMQKSIKKIALIPIGDISNEISARFSKNLNSFMENIEIKILENLNNAKKFDAQIILISSGKVTSEELHKYKTRLTLQDKDVLGIVILND